MAHTNNIEWLNENKIKYFFNGWGHTGKQCRTAGMRELKKCNFNKLTNNQLTAVHMLEIWNHQNYIQSQWQIYHFN